MDIYYENDFKEINSPIIVSKREASRKTPGCGINMHEYVEFYYIITGGIEVFCNGASEWIYPGDIAFINWCQPHKSLCFLDDTLYYIVQFDLNSLSCGNYDVFQTKYVTRLISDTGLFKTYFREDKILKSLFETLVYEYENKLFTYELSVQAAIFNILAIIINSAEDQEKIHKNQFNLTAIEYSKKLIQYLYINYQNTVNLTQISKELGISSSYMCRIFKQCTGTTIVEYVNQLRCKKAISLINDGETISQAAALVGYNDYNYFSRTFKKIYGMSPTSLIKQTSKDRHEESAEI